jgi:hypothetical protein
MIEWIIGAALLAGGLFGNNKTKSQSPRPVPGPREDFRQGRAMAHQLGTDRRSLTLDPQKHGIAHHCSVSAAQALRHLLSGWVAIASSRNCSPNLPRTMSPIWRSKRNG